VAARDDGRHDPPPTWNEVFTEARRQAPLLVGDAGGRLDVQGGVLARPLDA
jgi:hypothetical protein